MRRLQRQGEQTDATMEHLGKTIDGVVSTENIAEVAAYEHELASLDRQGRTTFNSLQRNAQESEYKVVGSIRRMDASTALLRGNLEELGRGDYTPKVNLKGVDSSLAKLELLERRLSSLSHRSVSPNVNAGSTLASSELRAAASSGGGGSSLGSGSLGIPFAGSIPYPLVGGALAAAAPVSGAAVALGGSLGGAALGAGSLALGAYGAGAAAVGATAPVAIDSISGIKKAATALASYRKEVIASGVNSEQARQAFRKYNIELRGAPAGTARLLRDKESLIEGFKESTKGAQGHFTGILNRGVNLGRQLTPLYSRDANVFLGGAQKQANQFGNFLNSKEARGFYNAETNAATQALGPTEDIAENVTSTLMNLSRAARPFFQEGLKFLDQWTGGWKTSSRDISGVRSDMHGWVGDLKSWGKLTASTFDILRDLGKASSGSGTSMVDDLTEQLETWDKWINANPVKVHRFFEESVSSTEKIAGALGHITGFIWRIGQMLTPLLTELSQFITFASNSGLLEPGVLPLLLAGGAGVRNVVGSARTRILGGSGAAAGTEAAVVAGTAAGGGGMAASRGILSRGRDFLGRTYGMGRVPIAGAGGTMAAEADAGLIGETRFSGMAAARYGAGELAGGAAAAGGSFLRGAGARFLPVAALLGGLQFASFPGNFEERGQAAASSLTMGLIPQPMTAAQRAEAGAAHAHNIAIHYASKYGSSLPGFNRQLAGLRRSRRALLRPERNPSFTQELFGENPVTGENDMHVSGENQHAAEALHKEMVALLGRRNAFAMERGHELGGQEQAAFAIRKKHGAVAALGDVKDEVLQQLDSKHLGKDGGRVLAQNVLMWAREAKRNNPKLTSVYEEMVNQIQSRFEKMGQSIEVINGRIYTGSAKEWQNIASAMSNPIERAREEMSKSFTAIEQQAIGSLTAMGFSRAQAKTLVNESEKGGRTGHIAKQNMEAGPVLGGNKISSPSETKAAGEGRFGKHHASGGRLPGGAGLHDNIYLGDGQWAAGDELMVNRHTERRVDRVLRMAGTSLGHEVRMENRAHSQGFATGGRGRGRGGGGGGGVHYDGHPSDIIPGLKTVLGDVERHFPGLVVTATTDGEHVPGSYHYKHEAVDISGGSGEMDQAASWIKSSGLYRQLVEGIHNPNLSVSDGHMVDPSFYSAVWAEHANHIHMAVDHAVNAAQLGRGGAGAAMGGHGAPGGRVNLKAPRSGQGGVPGALANRGSEMFAAGLSQTLNKHMGGHGRGAGLHVSGGGVSAQIARVLFGHGLNKVGAAGIIGNAYAESTLNPSAVGSGGGGLWGFTSSPYSLADLQAYAQKRHQPWGSATLQTEFLSKFLPRSLIGKLNSAGSPEQAAATFMSEWERPGIPRQSVREGGARTAFQQGFATGGRGQSGFAGWFADGFHGMVHGPTLMGVGERGPEEVHITPSPRRRRAGRGGVGSNFQVHVHMGGVSINSGADAQSVGEDVGRHAAKKIMEALENGDEVAEEELIGA